MRKCYINGIGCVSTQETFDDGFLENPIINESNHILPLVKPNYKAYISPVSIRRMSSGVKNSIVASSIAMNDAKIEELDAILTGTGMGCIQDSEKFLDKLINHDEEYLTPTSFIQSTHNTVGGQIALKLKSKAYNFTYVSTGNSFQSALLDGLLQTQDGRSENCLVGGIEELAPQTTKLYQVAGHVAKTEDAPFNIFNKRTKGSVTGEAASFYVLGAEKTENTYAELVDTHFINTLEKEEIPAFIEDFLARNKIDSSAIDVIINGNSGDVDFDPYYDAVENHLECRTVVVYKHLFGEFMTASSVSVWLGAKILKNQHIPSVLIKSKGENRDAINNILIYNNYRGKDHSLILLKNV